MRNAYQCALDRAVKLPKRLYEESIDELEKLREWEKLCRETK